MQRQKLAQEDLAQRLKILVPDAKFNVRPYDNNEHLVHTPVIRGDMLIDWPSINGPCPAMDAIEALTPEQVNSVEQYNNRMVRNAKYLKDLGVKAAFRIERKSNPMLTFSEFLDDLERDN
jgi:hypothetical protein